MSKSGIHYQSYRSSPIRNLDTSQAVKERFEDEFFQIKCTRLEKQKQQLEDEVTILNTKLLDNITSVQEVVLLNTKIAHLTDQNQILRLRLEELSISPSAESRVRKLFESRQRTQAEHLREVDDLMRLYETAKAETAIFRAQNQRLRVQQLRQSRGSDVDSLGKAMEISKLKLSINGIEAENQKLREQFQAQNNQIERLNKLYAYEKRTNEEREKQHQLLINQVEENSKQAKDKHYFAEETPIKIMTKDNDLIHAEEEISNLRNKLQVQNQAHQELINKYSTLANEYEQAIRERDQLRTTGQYTLRQVARENIAQRSRQQKGQAHQTKLRKVLKEKEEQIKSILTRFAPLLKIQQGEISLQQDRKQRIQKHWKADLAILDVLLNKYKIQSFKQNQ